MRPVPAEEAADFEEIVAAIEKLTPADWLRLRKFASFRMAGLYGSCGHGDDLLQEAIRLTAEGAPRADRDENDTIPDANTPAEPSKRRRRWRRSVPFVHHILGVMRSTSTAWREAAEKKPSVVSFSAITHADASAFDPPDTSPNPTRELVAAELLASIEREFEHDTVVLAVIDGLESGKSQQEIAVGISVPLPMVAAALKRLRRHVLKLRTSGCAP